MKCKKKSIKTEQLHFKPRLISNKNQKQLQKTLSTTKQTKQMTYATIQELKQNNDKIIINQNKYHSDRCSYLERMEANNMSPFSSAQPKSVTPKTPKNLKPKLPKDYNKLKKQIKSKKQNLQKKDKISKHSKQSKIQKLKLTQPKSLKKLFKIDTKKITQLSEEDIQLQGQKNKIELNGQLSQQKNINLQKQNGKTVKNMKIKLLEQYQKLYPNLKKRELEVLSSIVVIQRLWRERKVKKIIDKYLSPRSNQINQVDILPKRNIISKNQRQESSEQFNSLIQHSNPIDLKSLELSAQFNFSNWKQLNGLVNQYRNINLINRKNKKFSNQQFQYCQSFSEKCLMSKYYNKVFKQFTKDKKVIFFPQCQIKIKQQDQFQHQLIIKNIARDNIQLKNQKNHEFSQRFYTQHFQEQITKQSLKFNQIPNVIQQKTTKMITGVSELLLETLLEETIKQFGKLMKIKRNKLI